MRSLKDIKRSIKHAQVESKPRADETVRQHLLAELVTATAGVSAPIRPQGWRIAVKVVAVAAIVILALIVIDRRPQEVTPPPSVGSRPRSAAELLTVGSLNAACRRGGLEAIDQLCEEADRRLGTEPERISVRAFARELKGT